MGCGASLAQVVPDEPLPEVDLTAPLALDAGAIFAALDVENIFILIKFKCTHDCLFRLVDISLDC